MELPKKRVIPSDPCKINPPHSFAALISSSTPSFSPLTDSRPPTEALSLPFVPLPRVVSLSPIFPLLSVMLIFFLIAIVSSSFVLFKFRSPPLSNEMSIMSLSITGRESDLEKLRKLRKLQQLVYDLNFKLFRLIILCLLIQLFVYIFIFYASYLQCCNWWIPFFISLLSFLIIAFPIACTTLEYTHGTRQLFINRLKLLRQSIFAHDARRYLPDPFMWAWLYAFTGNVMLLLIFFTITVLHNCHSIPCDDQM